MTADLFLWIPLLLLAFWELKKSLAEERRIPYLHEVDLYHRRRR